MALLDRSIIVEGIQGGGSAAGHTLFLNPVGGVAPRGELESVEFRYLGNAGQLGRYPIHFHHAGDATGSFVRNCSIHETYNRALTLHATQNVEVTGNLSYDCLGHAFYFEDNSVTGCVMSGNVGLLTKAGTTLPSDARPGTFWVHNPLNEIDGNAAAGSAGDGFWFETEHGDPNPWTSFSGNVAHSNEQTGFMQDERRPAPAPPSIYSNLTAYKNRRYGIWLRTYGEAIVTDCQFADNRGGVYFASEGFQFNLHQYLHWGSASSSGISKVWLFDSLLIGETSNVGKPLTCQELMAGRSLPQRWPGGDPLLPAWDALVAVEVYDGFVGIEGCVFAEYRDKSLSDGGCSFERKAGALHQVFYYNPWSVDPRNRVADLTFINAGGTSTRPLYFRTPQGFQSPSWCASEFYLDDGGLANVILQDVDGSLSGTPGSCVYPLNPFLDPVSGSTLNPDWNAMSTSGPPPTPYAQLDFAQLYDLDATSTITRDGKPVLAIAGLHCVTRDQWFIKSAPVLGICSPTEERPIPRIVTNVITDDFYEYHYDPALIAADWPVSLALSLQFTEPGRWVYATIPLIAQPATADVVVNGTQAVMAADPGALHAGPGDQWWYDVPGQRIHLKLVTSGSGGTVDDGLRS
ncbi:MAG: right-handed parallel beta-helix repeat-containing protein, partial [Myxococcota bacterium]